MSIESKLITFEQLRMFLVENLQHTTIPSNTDGNTTVYLTNFDGLTKLTTELIANRDAEILALLRDWASVYHDLLSRSVHPFEDVHTRDKIRAVALELHTRIHQLSFLAGIDFKL